MRPERKKSRRWLGGLRTARRGGAVVEMAVVSPLLLMMIFGMIEFGYVFMMAQSITNAAREGCRTATLPGATDTDIQNRVSQALAPTGLQVTSSMVTITHATTQNPVVQVWVRVPYEQVTLLGVLPSSLFAGWFNKGGGGGGGENIQDKTIGSSCSMRLEVTTGT